MSGVFNMYEQEGYSKLNSHTAERYNRMGIGWTSNLPYIMTIEDTGRKIVNLFFQGNVYEIDQTGVQSTNPERSNLLGYDLEDLRIRESQGIAYSDFDTEGRSVSVNAILTNPEYGLSDSEYTRSKYVLTLKNDEQFFFREDGRLMMQKDSRGLNSIWYFYALDIDGAYLRLVVDTIDRNILFNYDGNGNLDNIQWQVKTGKKTGEIRSFITETRDIRYTYKNAEEFDDVLKLKEKVRDYQTSYVLSSVIRPLDENMPTTTQYEYGSGTANFSFNKTTGYATNAYLFLTGIYEHYTPGDGACKNKRCFEYSPGNPPSGEWYSKDFYNGYIKHYRVTRQYDINHFGRIMNDTHYWYYKKGEAENYNQYSTVIKQDN
jgi:hypothetical protein